MMGGWVNGGEAGGPVNVSDVDPVGIVVTEFKNKFKATRSRVTL